MKRTSRGSALLVAVIALLVMSVIGVAILRFGYREVAGASAGSREQAMVACAQAGQRLLASKFHALGTDPTQLAALNESLGAGLSVKGGHYSVADTAIQVTQVTALPKTATGPVSAARDISNTITNNPEPKAPYKIMVHCASANGTELEVEYGVKFGL